MYVKFSKVSMTQKTPWVKHHRCLRVSTSFGGQKTIHRSLANISRKSQNSLCPWLWQWSFHLSQCQLTPVSLSFIYLNQVPLIPSGYHSVARALFFFFFLIFIYLYLFLAVLGLRFCTRAFSSCGKRGPLLIAVRGPLTVVASLVAEHRLQTRRLSNCGSRAQPLRGMWDLPRPGLEPVSPALAGRFSTAAPPGKP